MFTIGVFLFLCTIEIMNFFQLDFIMQDIVSVQKYNYGEAIPYNIPTDKINLMFFISTVDQEIIDAA